MLTFLPLLALLQGFSLSNEAETKVTGKLGDTVTLPCVTTLRSPVDWRKLTATSDDYICIGGVIVPDLVPRFQLAKNNNGVYNLTITDVKLNDSGRYRCIENAGIGDEHLVVLTVEQRDDDDESGSIMAYVDNIIQLPCHPTIQLPVDWKKFNPSTGNDDYICMGGAIVKELTWRFEVVGYNLTIKEVAASDGGTYRCIEESGIGTEHIVRLKVNTTRDSPNVISSDETSTKTNQATVVVVCVVATVVVIAVGVFLVCFGWRHCRDLKPVVYWLEQTVTVKEKICGFAVVDKRLYVCVRESNKLLVFDENGNALDEVEIPDLQRPSDIVYCSKCNYMYIADRWSSSIWRLTVEGNQVKDKTSFEVQGQSTADKPGPDRLSIRSCRLLVTFTQELVLFKNVCTDDTADPIRILFPNMAVHYAVETGHGTFIVSHWDPKPRVIETDVDGVEVGLNEEENTSIRHRQDATAIELDVHYMDIDSSGRVYCANMTQNCIVLLSPNLRQKARCKLKCKPGQIKAERQVLVKRPNRIHCVDDQLLVSGYSGDIQIFKPVSTSTDRIV